ncbi:MAG: PIN domain-containing protein [Candidatus Sulfotelmatobacter sp.]
MIRAVLADSGPLFAIADESDGHHERALREFELLARDRREILVPYPILLETFTLALFRLGRKSASDWLTQILLAALVNPTPEDYRRAATQVLAPLHQSITLVDATVAAVAIRLGLQVWTYDHHFDAMRIPVWR